MLGQAFKDKCLKDDCTKLLYFDFLPEYLNSWSSIDVKNKEYVGNQMYCTVFFKVISEHKSTIRFLEPTMKHSTAYSYNKCSLE